MAADGAGVGATVGPAEGAGVGATVGLAEGALLGAGVGAALGAADLGGTYCPRERGKKFSAYLYLVCEIMIF